MHTIKNAQRVDYLKKHYHGNVDFLFYADYEDLDNNVYKVSNADYYESNEIKHINILNLIKQSEIYKKYSFVYFVDDDTYVSIINLKLFLEKFKDSKLSCIGQILQADTNPTNYVFKKYPDLKYPSGGAGYIMSADIFSNVQFKNFFTGYSDVSLGLNFNHFNNVRLIHSDLFNSQPPTFYKDSTDLQHEAISYHYIKTKQDFEACNILSKKSLSSVN